DAGVVEATDLLGNAGEIDRHAVALDHDLDADRHWHADRHAVIVHERFRLVDTVRHRGDALARDLFAVLHDGIDRGEHLVASVFADQFEKPFLAGLDRGDLRAEVAHGPLAQTHIRLDDRY